MRFFVDVEDKRGSISEITIDKAIQVLGISLLELAITISSG